VKNRIGQIVKVTNEGSGSEFHIIFKRDDMQEIPNEPVYLPEIYFANFPFNISSPDSFVGRAIEVRVFKEGEPAVEHDKGIEIRIYE